MKIQVLWVVFVLGAGLLLVGCGGAPAAPSSSEAAVLTIVSGEKEQDYNLADLRTLPAAEIRYTSKETGEENSYRGVRLKDLLAAAGANLESLNTVEVEAEDGFIATYDREVALRDTSVLVYEMDGGPLLESMGQVRMLSPGEGTKLQVKFVARLEVRD